METDPMNTNNNNTNNNDLSDDGNDDDGNDDGNDDDDDDDDDECFPWQDTQPVLPPNNSLTCFMLVVGACYKGPSQTTPFN